MSNDELDLSPYAHNRRVGEANTAEPKAPKKPRKDKAKDEAEPEPEG